MEVGKPIILAGAGGVLSWITDVWVTPTGKLSILREDFGNVDKLSLGVYLYEFSRDGSLLGPAERMW